MKRVCFRNITWDPFAEGEMPQLLSGLQASVFTLFTHSANPEFQTTFQRGISDKWLVQKKFKQLHGE